MKYKMKEDNGFWNIIETPTQHVIRSFKDREEAKKYMRNLNFGAVFDGWTPAFFLKDLNKNSEKKSM